MNDLTPTREQRTAALEGMGCKRKRVEDIRFTQGRGNYVDDVKLPGMLHGDFVRSPHPHARIKKIDDSEALKIPGVLAVITAETLKTVARKYARAERAIIFWGMGISQHVHGTDNSRCLIALALITGQIGRPGTGLHPLRGQNNVQGASDAGLIPMVYPDYQSVEDPKVRESFEALWQTPLDDKRGLIAVAASSNVGCVVVSRRMFV